MLYLFSLMRYIEFCKQSKPIKNVEILRFKIGQDYKEIWRTPGIVRVSTGSIKRRLQVGLEMKGGHFEHLP